MSRACTPLSRLWGLAGLFWASGPLPTPFLGPGCEASFGVCLSFSNVCFLWASGLLALVLDLWSLLGCAFKPSFGCCPREGAAAWPADPSAAIVLSCHYLATFTIQAIVYRDIMCFMYCMLPPCYLQLEPRAPHQPEAQLSLSCSHETLAYACKRWRLDRCMRAALAVLLWCCPTSRLDLRPGRRGCRPPALGTPLRSPCSGSHLLLEGLAALLASELPLDFRSLIVGRAVQAVSVFCVAAGS